MKKMFLSVFAGAVGMMAAVILGLGRALGETMAVTMLIGNRPEISLSLFAPAATMSSVIAKRQKDRGIYYRAIWIKANANNKKFTQNSQSH